MNYEIKGTHSRTRFIGRVGLKLKTTESKYKAKRTEINGVKFASKIEANVYSFLLENGIEILQLQPRYELQPKFKHNGETLRSIVYVSDFLIQIDGAEYIIEVKGMQTSEWKMKKKMFHYRYPNANLVVVKSLKEIREFIEKILTKKEKRI